MRWPSRGSCRADRTAPAAASLAIALAGCLLDPTGLRAGGDADAEPDADADPDGDADPDADPDEPDADVDLEPPCSEGAFECLEDGSARVCARGSWRSLGPCGLGCDPAERACRVPSNVGSELLDAGEGALDGAGWTSPITVDTGSGAITDGSGASVRPAGLGLDPTSGIAFATRAQGPGLPELGVFSMTGLSVPPDARVEVVGPRALVLLVLGDALVEGVVDAAGRGQAAGPGGFEGGEPGSAGRGDCGGAPGSGDAYGTRCTSGSGGGGQLGQGGSGAACLCSAPYDFAAGAGGAAGCGTEELVPLVGGSGGAGGSFATGAPDSVPGPGGGGGGAVQLTASGSIAVRSGGLTGGGGGGGEALSAGGAGGGAGGAVLLEAPSVTVAAGAVLAANGGGGGGGDCS